MFDSAAKCVLVQPSSSMQQCIETYGIDGDGEWVNNTISSQAQFWSCGMVSQRTASPNHNHDQRDLSRCRALAIEAASLIGKVWPLLRSGSDPETHPFFVAVQSGAVVPKQIDEGIIRIALGGTLHPEARVIIEPFAQGTHWWQEIEEDAQSIVAESPSHSSFDDLVKEWRELMRWFGANALASPSFVRTTDSVNPSQGLGCVFPCFIVGITDKGSLTGIATHVVE
jgi:hypothetical protein